MGERLRIMGTGRSINQQIFIEQLPLLAAGESSAGGRHIRKLSIKRWLWGRGRDVFFWNRIEREGGWLCFRTPEGLVHFVASVKSTFAVVPCRDRWPSRPYTPRPRMKNLTL